MADRNGLSAYGRANLSRSISQVLDNLARNPTFSGVSVNSGYRSPGRNAAVGGAKHSQHMKGTALDLNVGGLTNTQKQSLLDTAIGSGARGIGLYSSGNAIHVDTRASPAVWSDSYKGIPVSAAPSWAQASLKNMFSAQPTAYAQPPAVPAQFTKMTPTPVARPAAPSITPTTAGAGVPDVYGGTIGTATATDGNKVTRDAFGNIGVTNSYGVTSWSNPQGVGISRIGAPSLGKLSNPFSNAQPGSLANAAKGLMGSMAGAAIGGTFAGPIGAVLGGWLGNQAIQGVSPMRAVERATYKQDKATPRGQALNSNRSAEGMRGISPGAAAAVGAGRAGLY